MDKNIEGIFEGCSLEQQQNFRDLQQKKYELYGTIYRTTTVSKYGFGILAAIDTTLLFVTEPATVDNTLKPIAVGVSLSLLGHFAQRWSRDRRLHTELDLRSIQRVIDRRLGENTELED